MIGTLLSFAYTSFGQRADQLFDKYLSISQALVKSDGKAAAGSHDEFREHLEKAPDFVQKKDLLTSSDKMSKAGADPEKLRLAFAELSPAMWAYIRQVDSLSKDVFYQYCPMKKVYWLSDQAVIRNPYYGSKMLSCGSVRDKKVK